MSFVCSSPPRRPLLQLQSIFPLVFLNCRQPLQLSFTITHHHSTAAEHLQLSKLTPLLLLRWLFLHFPQLFKGAPANTNSSPIHTITITHLTQITIMAVNCSFASIIPAITLQFLSNHFFLFCRFEMLKFLKNPSPATPFLITVLPNRCVVSAGKPITTVAASIPKPIIPDAIQHCDASQILRCRRFPVLCSTQSRAVCS